MAKKSYIVTFRHVKSIKRDIWLQFENNEKNPPGGAVIQKNKKTNIKKLISSLLTHPLGVLGVSKAVPGSTKHAT